MGASLHFAGVPETLYFNTFYGANGNIKVEHYSNKSNRYVCEEF